MDHCGKRRIHILRRSEFLDLSQSSVDLVTHGGDNIVHRNHVLFVDKSFSPNFGIDFIALFQVFADIVLLLSNSLQLFASMDIHPCLSLTKL